MAKFTNYTCILVMFGPYFILILKLFSKIQNREEKKFMTDIEIAQATKMSHINDIAKKLNLCEDDIEQYGKFKAKINVENIKKDRNGKLILVTAVTPTKSGEGKTTVTIGLGDALQELNKSVCLALREPSLGPVFGMKGGAAGGGYSQVVPMEDINLHFTGDFHAIESANNLLAAMVDNSIFQGNPHNIDVNNIFWKRCVDMNDRALRNIIVGIGGPTYGVPREDHYLITVASEIMAIFCLASDLEDLKERIGRIVVATNKEGKPVTANDIGATGAMTALLIDAIKPNLVQTLEHTPAIVHGGPFANIAHGCNSVIATKTALKLADYVVTEAGFAADLGAQKFMDIKCRMSGLSPDCVVLVATCKAYTKENTYRHIENMQKYGVPVVVCINRFATDTDAQILEIINDCARVGIDVFVSNAYANGGKGALQLAEYVIDACDRKKEFKLMYSDEETIEDKVRILAREIYRAKDVNFSPKAKKFFKKLYEWNPEYQKLPICVAKTQYSISDKPELGTTPDDYILDVKDAYLNAGAGFVVILTGDIMTMPGLPKMPVALNIDVVDGKIKGLF